MLTVHVHIYRPRSIAKQGDNVLGSIHLSVRLWICVSLPVCLCVCDQWMYADNRADAVDRLLIHSGSELAAIRFILSWTFTPFL